MTIVHIVSFKSSSDEGLKKLTAAFLDLPKVCLRDDRPYILSARGGKQNSPEGKHHGMQVTFVTEFKNKEELDYYLDVDPAHDAFKKQCGTDFGVEDVVVLDFKDGSY